MSARSLCTSVLLIGLSLSLSACPKNHGRKRSAVPATAAQNQGRSNIPVVDAPAPDASEPAPNVTRRPVNPERRAPEPNTPPPEYTPPTERRDRGGEVVPAERMPVPPPGISTPPESWERPTADQCGTPFGKEDASWYPGLPHLPARAPKFTNGGILTSQESGVRFTDSSVDGLLNFSLDKVHALGPEAQNPSREFAMRIDDLRVETDIHGSRSVFVQFRYEHKPGEFTAIKMYGQMQGDRARDRVNVKIATRGGNFRFGGRVSCADQNGACESTLVTLQRINNQGRITREASAVHRWGSAHVQVSGQDQFEWDRIQNKHHREFARYMSNTVNNSCLAALYEAKTGARKMEKCLVDRLEQECGRENRVKLPAAKTFAIRSFAVAYGRAGFEFSAVDKANSRNRSENVRFLIGGPLTIAERPPMWVNKLHVEGIAGIERADLIMNDGGGNLNLQLVFKGQPKSHTRLSISTLFEPTRPELQGPVN